ncbi:hypothetical protein Zm00014a_009636 [Zea mays]|uniref:Uncharacterized protein n=1 Tax=Zea mays TaxID=4577 RepID=A0A3L6F957_MAIZE|nr:hypothetical protein Zm00014a_009636 [Zea mays]
MVKGPLGLDFAVATPNYWVHKGIAFICEIRTSLCGSPTHTTQAIVRLQPDIGSSGDDTSFHLQQPMEADGGASRLALAAGARGQAIARDGGGGGCECSHLRCLAWMLLARCVLGKLQVHRLVKHVCPKVNIQKDNGVQMKIIGTHVDATELVYDEDSYNKGYNFQ